MSLQNAGGVNLINISWTATTMTGVNQSYIIVFDAHIIKTTYLYHIFHQEITSADAIVNCGLHLAFVKAVNVAGESDPSNNVSIPSLSARVYNRKEGECPTPVWYCVTTLYGGHDLCNDIHKLEGSQFVPIQLQWAILSACIQSHSHVQVCLKCKL